jgi:CheY-like chemotaxis protein
VSTRLTASSSQPTERVALLPLLVVEDDPDGQELISRILGFHHMPHEVVFTAEEALELTTRCQFSAAILDLDLPEIDGWTLLTRLQTSPRTQHMPCVAITAYHAAEMAMRAREVGFKAYFPKPLDPRRFVADLEAVLYGHPSSTTKG